MSRRIAAVSLLALIVGCVGDQATPASEGTSSATSETTSTSTTASTSTTEFAEFDQEEADRLLEERFGTTTTTAEAAFVPNDPTDEEIQRLILTAGLTLTDTRFNIEEVGTDEWGAMLRDGSIAACRALFEGEPPSEALRSALAAAPDVNPSNLDGQDTDLLPLAMVFLTNGIEMYCPDLWSVDSANSEEEAQRITNVWAELMGFPPIDGNDGEDTTEVPDAEGIRQAIISDLEAADFDRVEVVTLGDGQIVIEGRIRWASQDRQRPSHFATVEYIADIGSSFSPAALEFLFGTEAPVLVLTTTSTSGDYPISSTTSWDLLEQVNDRQISADDWWEEASG